MKYVIFRTSNYTRCSEEPPCDSAVLSTFILHGECKKCWRIELNTLEDLIELCKTCDEELIVSIGDDNNLEIEIHDDWRM